MLTTYQKEQLVILQRCMWRGMRLAQAGEASCTDFVDLFQHMLDEHHRLRESYD